ncbi:MAG: hypothetical protein E7774_03635 [Bradyrhizobium sp.]|nr:MAG: hypothetical protein E7774_03635 [Bradyrhizobium sp.]
MFRLAFRLFGWVLLAGAFAAAVIDGARSLADQRLELTSLGRALTATIPSKFELVQPFVVKRAPLLWDPVLINMLYAPAALVLAALGLAIFYVTRRRVEALRASHRFR